MTVSPLPALSTAVAAPCSQTRAELVSEPAQAPQTVQPQPAPTSQKPGPSAEAPKRPMSHPGTSADASAGTPVTAVLEPAALKKSAAQSPGLFVEVFAGTGRMAKAFAQQGFQVLAVDSSAPQGVPALTLDLCKAHNQKVLLDLVQSSRVTAVHLAPPCSTSSAARQIDIGPGSPQPLRDFLHPDGLSDLPFHLRHRVSLANRLYSLTADVIRACAQAGTVWSLENPQSSLF